ncbi:MAG TPA: hypothetical protein VEC76_06135 [Streptosporangiaceae bacterium]|nr:hypothetical protein [Streptosporangiaceae bacterium]
MHPDIARSLAAQRQSELHRLAGRHRLARQQRRAARWPDGQPPAMAGRPAAVRLAIRRLLARLPVVGLSGARPGQGRGPAAGPTDIALPGVFAAGPEAFGLRTYLTPAEARQLAADWADLLAAFADRVDDPSCRPEGAVPFELVVLGRQVPDLAGAAHGLPGPGQAD